MLVNSPAGYEFSFADWGNVLLHGLSLDFSMSGYLMVFPALMLIASIWFKPEIVGKILNVYFLIVLSLVAIIGVVDIILYPYWGFHFDSSVFLYLKNPKGALASASVWEMVIGVVAMVGIVAILYIGYVFAIGRQVKALSVPKRIGATCVVLLLLTAALFLPIRGGVTVSTMNVGKAYFSDNMFLNHAAINPQFNLMYSFSKSEDFGNQYQFFDKQEAGRIFAELNNQPPCDSIPQLLTTNRPNIILFMLESFSADVALNPQIAPNLCRMAGQGVLFSNFYANSFRTDRGLVSILSGYPGHPTVAIMKYPQKTQKLPTITKTLKDNGYELSFHYGGDADFANMRSYFVGACGISNITEDEEFPLAQRLTKWGVPDEHLLDRLYSDLTTTQQDKPFMATVLTLSSHEPFDVSTKKFGEPFLNSIAYTDSCIGVFMDKLKATDLWSNTLVVFVADHAMQSYPKGAESNSPHRFHIPLVWAGGAVKQPLVVSDYGSQNDLAATLLSQLKIGHKEFIFSKDMMNPLADKFAFYSYVNGFSMTDRAGTIVYDNDKGGILKITGNKDMMDKKAKAFFQTMYSDLGSR
ncbi:LTA synthase family protein [Dysgonomonas sp. PH5-37]|uniref:LTA synthase family protein n=2 Tax=unclassified Dysgonomonas TaxID=2630389 RepID=UPI002476315C|nr:alkaline phosphatase family protein [Dysgonomonas sp. PH5-37]